MKTVLANLRLAVLGLSFVGGSQVFAVTTELGRFVNNSGHYVSAETNHANLCYSRYQNLDLDVNPDAKAVKVILSGSGNENGHPTAGE